MRTVKEKQSDLCRIQLITIQCSAMAEVACLNASECCQLFLAVSPAEPFPGRRLFLATYLRDRPLRAITMFRTIRIRVHLQPKNPYHRAELSVPQVWPARSDS